MMEILSLSNLCLAMLIFVYSLKLAPMMFESFTSDRIWASNPPESFYMFLGPYGQKTAHYWRIVSPLVWLLFVLSFIVNCVHVLAVGLFHREASVKNNMFVALLLALATAGTAAAQPAPFNDVGITMGHWHIASKDVEANKKLFLAMGGKLFMPGGNPLIMFPGLYINLNLGNEKGEGGTEGSVVNHVGFIVNNVQERVAQWKAAGVAVLPGNNNRLDQAFVVTPDGVRIEVLEDKMQPMPVRNEHVHLSVPEAEIPKAQAWYAKTFGGKPGTRNNAPVVDLPGVQFRFARADAKQAATRGRVLDHIGFDVKDHAAFVKKLEAEGITLDEPVRKSAAGNTITYITDPWGTRIEIVQRAPLGQPVQ